MTFFQNVFKSVKTGIENITHHDERSRSRSMSSLEIARASEDTDIDDWTLVDRDVNRGSKKVNMEKRLKKDNIILLKGRDTVNILDYQKCVRRFEKRSWRFPTSGYPQDCLDRNPAEKDECYEIVRMMLDEDRIDVVNLKKYIWKEGVHPDLKGECMEVITGYLPPWPHMYDDVRLVKKNLYQKYFVQHSASLKDKEKELIETIKGELRECAMNFPRLQNEALMHVILRAVYTCANEGFNSFISSNPIGLSHLAIPIAGSLFRSVDFSHIEEDEKYSLEADLFWILYETCKKDNNSQFVNPSNQIHYLEQLISRYDPELSQHFKNLESSIFTLVFSVTSALLLDKIKKFGLINYIWDRYMVCFDNFSKFHTIACCQFLLNYSDKLLLLDQPHQIQEFMMLQSLDWHYKNAKVFVNKICEKAEEEGLFDPSQPGEFDNLVIIPDLEKRMEVQQQK